MKLKSNILRRYLIQKDVQNYNKDGWYYKTELHKFVNSGMTDTKFIDAVSGNTECDHCSNGLFLLLKSANI